MKRTPLLRKSAIHRNRKPVERSERPPRYYEAPKPAVLVMDDGREICNLRTTAGKAEYKRRIQVMFERQGQRCGLQINGGCKAVHGRMYSRDATFEHVDGRGMGGGHRDDRIEKDGKPYNLAACWRCNSDKGSRRMGFCAS